MVGDWLGPGGRPCGVIIWPAHSKSGVGSRAQGEGLGFLFLRVGETASGWFHRAASTSRSSRWKDNGPVLRRAIDASWAALNSTTTFFVLSLS